MRHLFLSAWMLLGGLLLTACVDKSYDLDNVDLAMSTNANLALPLINTSDIKLADFMLPNDFLGTTTIPGQDGKVIYAHTSTDEDNPTTIEISAVADGTVEYTSTTPDITIPELPDFLKGEGVHLDLKNPIIIVNVESNLPEGCNVKADIEISTSDASCKVNGLKASGTKKLCQYIATDAHNNIPAELLKEEFGTPVQLKPLTGNGVNELFKNKIPEALHVNVTNLIAEDVGSTPIVGPFNISIGLTLYAPLCIGSSNFSLSYEAIETGWSNEFNNDVRKMDVDALVIKANLTNNLPLSVDVNIIPIDCNGNDIPGLTVLEANAKSDNNSVVEYTMKAKEPGKTLRDYLNGSQPLYGGPEGKEQLDGVRIVTTLKADTKSIGKYITDNLSVRFTNLELRAKGKFTYDAN